ncbi:hypothetical protein TI01_1439 [Lysobacter sp. A03]|nr:hypothetical protein TI01_1439 [Lysobacter sp. A03]
MPVAPLGAGDNVPLWTDRDPDPALTGLAGVALDIVAHRQPGVGRRRQASALQHLGHDRPCGRGGNLSRIVSQGTPSDGSQCQTGRQHRQTTPPALAWCRIKPLPMHS